MNGSGGTPSHRHDDDPDVERTGAALILTIAALALYNLVRGLAVPASWQLATNLAMAGVVGVVARWAGLTTHELGLRRDRLRAGLGWGGGAILLVVVVVGGVALLSRTGPAGGSEVFTDSRVRVPVAALLFDVLVNTPFGTVVLEELAFRGVLLALFRRRTSTRWAVLWSSLLFGCWHILPTITTAPGNAQLATATGTTAGLVLVVAGNVATTTIGGAVFCWLRLRADSLLAPVLAHLGTNDATYVVAWLANR